MASGDLGHEDTSVGGTPAALRLRALPPLRLSPHYGVTKLVCLSSLLQNAVTQTSGLDSKGEKLSPPADESPGSGKDCWSLQTQPSRGASAPGCVTSHNTISFSEPQSCESNKTRARLN